MEANDLLWFANVIFSGQVGRRCRCCKSKQPVFKWLDTRLLGIQSQYCPFIFGSDKSVCVCVFKKRFELV